ncbi:hypothetical protein [uncultured Dysosmobacter sp.]|uniref:hypothetical protein n=1 Tax=uncultured Dysosmobacter sp. TaxID=2591384 RepID=UPI00261A6385|nr:hypothetical protein [uncultured Dysosmobacter sp.]
MKSKSKPQTAACHSACAAALEKWLYHFSSDLIIPQQAWSFKVRALKSGGMALAVEEQVGEWKEHLRFPKKCGMLKTDEIALAKSNKGAR